MTSCRKWELNSMKSSSSLYKLSCYCNTNKTFQNQTSFFFSYFTITVFFSGQSLIEWHSAFQDVLFFFFSYFSITPGYIFLLLCFLASSPYFNFCKGYIYVYPYMFFNLRRNLKSTFTGVYLSPWSPILQHCVAPNFDR